MSAILKERFREKLSWVVTIFYEEQDTERTYNVASVQGDAIPALVRSEVASFAQLKDSDGKCPFNPGDVIPITPPVAVPQTPDQIAHNEFLSNLNRLMRLLAVLPETDQRIKDLRATIAPQVDLYL